MYLQKKNSHNIKLELGPNTKSKTLFPKNNLSPRPRDYSH